MKVYVASSWRNPKQPEVVQAIRALGHEVYDFRNPHATGERQNGEKGKGFHWTEIDPNWRNWTPTELRSALDTPRAVEGFHSDSDALDWCDVCVMVPGETAGRSMHLELGYAVGRGKRTIILLSNGEPELMYKFASHIAVNMDELGELLGRNGYDVPADQTSAPRATGLQFGENRRTGDDRVHQEWHAACGCAYHPEPFPHVHPCSDAHKRPDLHVRDLH